MSTNASSALETARPEGSRWLWFFVAAWAAAITAITFELVERLGFDPTDDGFVLAQAYRILHGQVPHRDFISPRPVGSPLLHTFDHLLPLPSLEATRLIGLVEIVAYTLLFASFVFTRPVRKWRGWEFALITIAVLVNRHVYPVMGWPTIDGLLLVAGGIIVLRAAVRRESDGLIYVGLLLLGLSAVMKQSFYMAPALGFLWFVYRSSRKERKHLLRTGGAALICAAGPLAAYAGVIAALGGWHQMIRQLTDLPLLDIRGWFFVVRGPGSAVVFVFLLMALGLMLLIEHPSVQGVGVWSDLFVRGAASAMILLVPITQHFAGPLTGTWPTQLFWALLFILMIDRVTTGRTDWIGVTMVFVALMTMLSWGYPTAGLVGGSIIVWLLIRIWKPVRMTPMHLKLLSPIAVLLVAAVSVSAVHSMRTYTYYDRPAPQLTVSLASVSPDLRGIKTNPTTGLYMQDMVSCIRRYPASHVAVLPDNPFIYPALHLRDPFPLDWMWPPEYRSSPERIIDAANMLARGGDYLVLYQPVYAFDLAKFSLTQLRARRGSLLRSDPLLREIDQRLVKGSLLSCGVFTARYAAGPVRS